jgi:hypothetical protein
MKLLIIVPLLFLFGCSDKLTDKEIMQEYIVYERMVEKPFSYEIFRAKKLGATDEELRAMFDEEIRQTRKRMQAHAERISTGGRFIRTGKTD